MIDRTLLYMVLIWAFALIVVKNFGHIIDSLSHTLRQAFVGEYDNEDVLPPTKVPVDIRGQDYDLDLQSYSSLMRSISMQDFGVPSRPVRCTANGRTFMFPRSMSRRHKPTGTRFDLQI
jgi:hypothetical protein